MFKALHFFLMIIFTSCTSGPQYIIDCDRVTGKKANQLCKEENLSIFCTGGAMMTNIKKISVSFQKNGPVQLSEARRLCIKCLEELRTTVNSTECLRDHLNPYPFPVSGMQISLIFVDDNGIHFPYGSVESGQGGISSMRQLNNYVYYSSYNPETNLLEDYYHETYEEALRIVNEEYGYCY